MWTLRLTGLNYRKIRAHLDYLQERDVMELIENLKRCQKR